MSNIETVQGFLDLQYQGKIDEAFASHADKNFSWIVGSRANEELTKAIPWAGYNHKGLEGYKTLVSLLFGEYDAEVFEVHQYHEVNDQVFAVGHFRFKHKETGKIADSDFIGRFEMKQGKIAGGQFYENTHAVAAGRIK
ncbi:MAG: nuclear transport factor 2 family protein [Bacteroidota bacterium]